MSDSFISEVVRSNQLRMDDDYSYSIDNGKMLISQPQTMMSMVGQKIGKGVEAGIEGAKGVIKGVPTGLGNFAEQFNKTFLPGYEETVVPLLNENVPGLKSLNSFLQDTFEYKNKAQEIGGSFIGEPIGEFGVTGGALSGVAKGAGVTNRFLSNVLGYGTAEAIAVPVDEQGLLSMGIDYLAPDSQVTTAILESLKSDEDQSVFIQKLQKAPENFFVGGVVGEQLDKAIQGVGTLYKYIKNSPKLDSIKQELKGDISNLGDKAREFIEKDGGGTRLGANDMSNIIAQGVKAIDETINPQNISKTSKPPSDNVMGINVRSDTKNNLSYADLIIDGKKTFETRDTNSLKSYIGKNVPIVKTGEGDAKAIGTVTIGEPIEVDAEQFRQLQNQHLVPEGSTFDIKEGKTKFLYPLSNPKRFNTDLNVASGIVSRKLLQSDTVLDDTKAVLDARAKQMQLKTEDRVQPSGQDPLFDTSKQSYEQTKVEQKEIVLPRNNGEVALLPIRDRARAVLDNTDNIAQEIAKSIKPVIGSNVQYFYHTAPLIDKAVALGIPENLAKKQLFKFAQNYAVTSPRTTTDQNLRNASLVSAKETLGKDVTEIIGSGSEGINEKGYPMMIGDGGIHKKLIDDKQAEGLNVNTNPKPVSFAENVSGNLKAVTVDTHAIRAVFHVMNKLNPGSVPLDFIGGKTPKKTKEFQEMYKNDPSTLDVATMIKDTLASQMIDGQSMQTEYAVFADIYKKVAELAGINPAEAQSLTWFSFGDVTGLASAPKTIVELIDDRVDVTSKLTSQSKEEVFKKFMQGGIPLLSVPAGVTLLDTGAMMEGDDG